MHILTGILRSTVRWFTKPLGIAVLALVFIGSAFAVVWDLYDSNDGNKIPLSLQKYKQLISYRWEFAEVRLVGEGSAADSAYARRYNAAAPIAKRYMDIPEVDRGRDSVMEIYPGVLCRNARIDTRLDFKISTPLHLNLADATYMKKGNVLKGVWLLVTDHFDWAIWIFNQKGQNWFRDRIIKFGSPDACHPSYERQYYGLKSGEIIRNTPYSINYSMITPPVQEHAIIDTSAPAFDALQYGSKITMSNDTCVIPAQRGSARFEYRFVPFSFAFPSRLYTDDYEGKAYPIKDMVPWEYIQAAINFKEEKGRWPRYSREIGVAESRDYQKLVTIPIGVIMAQDLKWSWKLESISTGYKRKIFSPQFSDFFGYSIEPFDNGKHLMVKAVLKHKTWECPKGSYWYACTDGQKGFVISGDTPKWSVK